MNVKAVSARTRCVCLNILAEIIIFSEYCGLVRVFFSENRASLAIRHNRQYVSYLNDKESTKIRIIGAHFSLSTDFYQFIYTPYNGYYA